MYTLADPGFDLRGGGVDFVNGEGGGRKSLKVLNVEVNVIILACFGHISIKTMLKSNRERSERQKNCEN